MEAGEGKNVVKQRQSRTGGRKNIRFQILCDSKRIKRKKGRKKLRLHSVIQTPSKCWKLVNLSGVAGV